MHRREVTAKQQRRGSLAAALVAQAVVLLLLRDAGPLLHVAAAVLALGIAAAVWFWYDGLRHELGALRHEFDLEQPAAAADPCRSGPLQAVDPITLMPLREVPVKND